MIEGRRRAPGSRPRSPPHRPGSRSRGARGRRRAGRAACRRPCPGAARSCSPVLGDSRNSLAGSSAVALERADATLVGRIERAQRLDLVAEPLDADGQRLAGREDVDDAATAGQLAAAADLGHGLVAQVDQRRRTRSWVIRAPRAEAQPARRADRVGRQGALEERLDAGDQDARGAVGRHHAASVATRAALSSRTSSERSQASEVRGSRVTTAAGSPSQARSSSATRSAISASRAIQTSRSPVARRRAPPPGTSWRHAAPRVRDVAQRLGRTGRRSTREPFDQRGQLTAFRQQRPTRADRSGARWRGESPPPGRSRLGCRLARASRQSVARARVGREDRARQRSSRSLRRGAPGSSFRQPVFVRTMPSSIRSPQAADRPSVRSFGCRPPTEPYRRPRRGRLARQRPGIPAIRGPGGDRPGPVLDRVRSRVQDGVEPSSRLCRTATARGSLASRSGDGSPMPTRSRAIFWVSISATIDRRPLCFHQNGFRFILIQ